jgi:hypothetical protein
MTGIVRYGFRWLVLRVVRSLQGKESDANRHRLPKGLRAKF